MEIDEKKRRKISRELSRIVISFREAAKERRERAEE
jgi:hypothetical protein